MFARLALLFVVVPLIELALLIQVGQVIGLGPTILLVLATGVGGAALARREGLRTVAAIQGELSQGRLPGDALMDGAAILFGGALLLTPGVLTDVFGISLLLPGTRRWMARRIRGWMEKQVKSGRVKWTVMGPGAGGFGVGGFGGAGFGAGPGFGMDEDESTGEPQSDAATRLGLDPKNEIDAG